ncbi:type II CAAX endopeptidase family protein [Flavivirga abyssicola]|uniref:type II CAAX endopeptidase family protein n=1 Tax=Flavivirga abyssicola TaxID=3063533 RepID=UPI0026E0F07D|nr:type II CAAX endopeptidase family protein [Flavivirga sp. MEBiC07777]WVK13120.1 type II CAAX endopeptidase family protein [Flavivirga sp. MEBiC07777]
MKKFLQLVFILFTFSVSSQGIKVNQKNSYTLFVKTLTNSKEIKYQDILNAYNNFIALHPENITVKVYKCKFIGSAYYDENEGYNLKYEETQECIDDLYSTYPNNPEVLLYKLENTYGEEGNELIDNIISIYKSNETDWNFEQISHFYEICANRFYDDHYKSISYAKKAEKFNDTLDLSVLISRAYLNLNNKEKAKKRLLTSLDIDHEAWVLNEKGKLLVELNEYEKALKMFDRVNEKDSTLLNTEGLYKIFLEKENYKQARMYLLKDTLDTWNKTINIQKLFSHDLLYSNPQLALESYRRLQKESYYDDFLGIKRLKLFIKSPFESWTFTEISHLLILVALIVVLFLIPYLWILPIYSFSRFFKLEKVKTEEKLSVNWSLKHFWVISFFYLFCQVVLGLVYYYQDYINYLFDIGYSYVDESLVESELEIANSVIVFSSLMLVSTLLFLNKKRLKFVLSSIFSFRQMIGFSILFVVFNFIILKILGGFFDLTDAANFIKALSAKEEIVAVFNEYGFVISVLIVALIVPFYEEIIFRGVILSSTEKHLGFARANIIQACLFATVHFSLKFFIFYFIFGIITGYTVKRTNGLFTGIVFHAVNNFAALFAIYMATKLLSGI